MGRPVKRLNQDDDSTAKGPSIALLLETERQLRKRLKEETKPYQLDLLIRAAVRLINALITTTGGGARFDMGEHLDKKKMRGGARSLSVPQADGADDDLAFADWQPPSQTAHNDSDDEDDHDDD